MQSPQNIITIASWKVEEEDVKLANFHLPAIGVMKGLKYWYWSIKGHYLLLPAFFVPEHLNEQSLRQPQLTTKQPNLWKEEEDTINSPNHTLY